MIDWVTALVSLASSEGVPDWSRRAGCTVFVRPGGDIDHTVDRWLPIKGSYDEAMRAKPARIGLWVSGNPAKLLTGQNSDGTDDLPALLAAVARRTAPALLPVVINMPVVGTLSRVDITRSYDLGAVERVREVLRVASITARARRQGASTTSHQTVYLGQHSRRHSVKLYAKHDELLAHPPVGLPANVYGSLLEQSRGLLRIEVTVRGQQLRDSGIHTIADWSRPGMANEQWLRYWSRVDLSSGVDLTPDDVLAMPRPLRRTYDAWRRGADMQEMLGKTQYYKHKKLLLTISGGAVDISVMRPAIVGASIAASDIGGYLRSLQPWRASGVLAEWIAEKAA